MRPDLDIVASLVCSGQRVLDLGCGDGALLENLINERECSGLGVERELDDFHACISRGVPVTQGDLEAELPRFSEGEFDVAVLSLTLQAVRHPDRVLTEMKRVAARLVVSLPNFAHWRLRATLTVRGRMPVTDSLPYQWFDTPNIHLCTIRDFESLARDLGLGIDRRILIDATGNRVGGLANRAPNLLAERAVYSLET
ncbi:MAG: methionine biosynthesis protein MetW [Solirubrobacterales bacterium]|jgi:methionine biosynthesis protein MetW|nr:methionine biosynthesis protein MetW [Solirubrobacterales bacterium]